MRKKTDKELGVVLPESMVDAIDNKALTDVQIGQLVRAILWNSMEYSNDVVVATLARTLVSTYRGTNSARLRKIKDTRQSKAEYERKRREKANIVEEAILKTVRKNMEFHGTLTEFHGKQHVRTCAEAENKKSEKERSKEKEKSTKEDIPPIKSPQGGDKKSSSAKAEGHAPNGSPPTRPATGSPAKRTGTKRATGGSGTTAAPATREDRTSASRGAAPSKKTGAPEALTDEYLVEVAKAMVERHPNAKSSQHAVNRAMADAATQEPGGGKATVDAIGAAHAAWCATDGWSAESGQYVQALAAWIRNGGWRKLPPQKKKPAPPKGDEISFDASL